MTARPLLQLHFDVNGTIILQDAQIGKKDVQPVLKGNLAKRSIVRMQDGKPVWNGNKDWRNWDNLCCKEKGELTLEEFWLSHPYLSKNIRKETFYNEFYENQLSVELEEDLENLMKKYQLLEGKEKDHRIIPSFFKLISHLLEHKRHFNIIIRTFGPERRVGTLIREINDFFSNSHSNCEIFMKEGEDIEIHSHRALSEDKVGVLHRDNHGSVLNFGQSERPPNALKWSRTFFDNNHTDKSNTTSENVTQRRFSHYVKPEQDERNGRKFLMDAAKDDVVYDGHQEIFDKFKESTDTQETLIVRDDFPWWLANNNEHHCGKPLVVDRSDGSIHPIIFDDNIWSHADDLKIVDVIDISSGERLGYSDSNEIFVVSANILMALDDEDYFIKKVDLCEKNRASSII